MGLSIQEINRIYDQFETKDMPRHEFIKEMQRLTNPTETQLELGRIMQRKRVAATIALAEKHKIDRAIENAG